MAIIKESHLVPKLKSPQRLSDYVVGIFQSITSKKGMRKAIDKRLVNINDKTGYTSNYINGGETITLLEEEISDNARPRPVKLDIEVLYEDAHFAVVNKPAGLLVHGNQKVTLTNALPLTLQRSYEVDYVTHPDPIHRLDYPTSGVLLVGKTRTTITALNKLFEERKVDKVYYAITIGKMKKKSDKIENTIKGKKAITHYEVEKTIESDKYGALNLVKLMPVTGRRHQLRIHMSELGNPILGDKSYGTDGKISRGKGLYLHAYSISFVHPKSGNRILITKPRPKKFHIIPMKEDEQE